MLCRFPSLATLGITLLLSSFADATDHRPFAFVDGVQFLEWPHKTRLDYVNGVVDTLSYLTEVTDAQRGISRCLWESDRKFFDVILLKMIAEDAVERAIKEGRTKVSVPEVFFTDLKKICKDHYPDQ